MPDPTGRDALPILAPDLPHNDIQLAGDRATQLNLHAQAQEMVETYQLRPDTPPWTRLSLGWLRDHGLDILILPADLSDAQNEHLAAALRRHGHNTLIGAVVDPAPAPPAAVFRLPATADDMLDFRISHTGILALTFSEDRSIALHCDSDKILLAGPSDFLREAVPERDALRARMDEDNRHMSKIYGGDWLGGIFRRYADVTLRD